MNSVLILFVFSVIGFFLTGIYVAILENNENKYSATFTAKCMFASLSFAVAIMGMFASLIFLLVEIYG